MPLVVETQVLGTLADFIRVSSNEMNQCFQVKSFPILRRSYLKSLLDDLIGNLGNLAAGLSFALFSGQGDNASKNEPCYTSTTSISTNEFLPSLPTSRGQPRSSFLFVGTDITSWFEGLPGGPLAHVRMIAYLSIYRGYSCYSGCSQCCVSLRLALTRLFHVPWRSEHHAAMCRAHSGLQLFH
jgi:hypothetical protein